MKLRTWSGSIIETKDYDIGIWWRWGMGWARHAMSQFSRKG